MSDNRWSGVHGKNSGLDGDETSTGQYVMAEAGLVSERKTKAVSVTERPLPKMRTTWSDCFRRSPTDQLTGMAVAADG